MAHCKRCGVDKDKIQNAFFESMAHTSKLIHEKEILEATNTALLAALEQAVIMVQAYNRLTGKGADVCAEMCAAIAKAEPK